MAVIIDDPSASIDMNKLVQELKNQGLPSYARPCFIRLTKQIELTGSFTYLRLFFNFYFFSSRNIQSEKNGVSRRSL
jgi:hypothetical protein